MPGGRTWPKCGTSNPADAVLCNLCKEAFTRKPSSSLRPGPMLPFNEAAAGKVRLSRLLGAAVHAPADGAAHPTTESHGRPEKMRRALSNGGNACRAT